MPLQGALTCAKNQAPTSTQVALAEIRKAVESSGNVFIVEPNAAENLVESKAFVGPLRSDWSKWAFVIFVTESAETLWKLFDWARLAVSSLSQGYEPPLTVDARDGGVTPTRAKLVTVSARSSGGLSQ